ncbi:MAG: hypothetical protein IJ217_01335 [Clostridia bacterium]|nr:hypothetical protein [Clostridia bacterium]
MSDVKGIEVHDILGLEEPLTKLFECVSNEIGKLDITGLNNSNYFKNTNKHTMKIIYI